MNKKLKSKAVDKMSVILAAASIAGWSGIGWMVFNIPSEIREISKHCEESMDIPHQNKLCNPEEQKSRHDRALGVYSLFSGLAVGGLYGFMDTREKIWANGGRYFSFRK